MPAGEIAQLMVTVGADIRDMQSGLNDAEGEIRNFAANQVALDKSADASADAMLRGASAINDFTGALGMVSPQLSGVLGLLGRLGELGPVFGVIAGGVFFLDKYIRSVLEQGAIGSELLNVERGFYNVAEGAGISGDAMYEAMVKASRGIVDTSDLMREFVPTTRAAGAAMVEFPALIETAMAMASEGTGDTLSNLRALNQYIRTGFAGGMMGGGLKGLGIAVPEAGALEAAYAASIGKTRQELTEAEQAQARMNVVLDVARGKWDLATAGVDLAGISTQRLKVANQELSESWARAYQPASEQLAAIGAWFVDLEIKAAGAYTAIDMAMRRWSVRAGADVTVGPIEASAAAANLLLGVLAALGITSGPVWDRLASQAAEAARTINDVNEAEARTLATLDRGSDAAQRLGVTTAVAAGDLYLMQAALDIAQRAGLGHIRITTELTGRFEALALQMAGTRKEAGQMGAAIDGGGKLARLAAMGYDVAAASVDRYGAAAARATGALGSLQRAQQGFGMGGTTFVPETGTVGGGAGFGANIPTFGGGGGGGLSDAASSMQQFQDSYNGMISSIMQPTQAVNLTSLEDQMGLHVDTWDEYARRAMDVANRGTESPWAAILGLDSKEEALSAVRQFYNFELPGEINVNAIADRVREYVGQQSAMQGALSQVKDQLAAEGLDVSNVDLQKALGVDMGAIGTSDGEAYAGAFGDSVTTGLSNGEQVGKDYTTKVQAGAMLAADNSRWRSAFSQKFKPDIPALVEDYMNSRGGALP